jgi:hypothetical protein
MPFAASTMHGFDMAAIAQATGSVISAVLLGAVAGAGVLPFPRHAFEGANDQILEIAEFMHRSTQEIADTLAAPLGRLVLPTGRVLSLIDMTRKGRVVTTTSLRDFLML